MVNTASHVIAASVPGIRPNQSSPDFISTLYQAADLVSFDTAVCDAGYDNAHNLRLCRKGVGMRPSVSALNPRNTGERAPRKPCRYALVRDFPPRPAGSSAGTSRARSVGTSGALAKL